MSGHQSGWAHVARGRPRVGKLGRRVRGWSRPDAVAGMQARVAQREAERAEALRSGKRRWRKRVKTFAGAMALALASVVSPTASAAGFGIGLGAPLEERVGG